MTERDLENRYRDILRNMRFYCGPECDVIPITSCQSSWYWLRKEHHTRLEFACRDIDSPALNHQSTTISALGTDDPTMDGREKTGNIFRYGKREFMRKMVVQGKIRLSPAEIYERNEHNDARRDDELQKHSYKPGLYTTITHESGQAIKVVGDVRRTVEGLPYHLVCFSCLWHPELFDEFEADTCVIVTDTTEFARRLEASGVSVFPEANFFHGSVAYFDPYEHGENDYFVSALSKDFRFAYQKEYRILWSQMNTTPLKGYQCVDIGPANDIMKMYDKSGREISE